ncbi:hypothetical protein DPMN_140026 [Dreissena polymorpha]|uniref:Uncharacterized protein n=1 Tax=Dreissena polymorpha TaxID=45954 RepID=A0A9D4G6U5_DREPO|nr:hypothetical protein DPMN_140026 [Dreissena polymorpha]
MTLALHSLVEARRIGRRIVARSQGTIRGRAMLVTLSDLRYVNESMDSATVEQGTKLSQNQVFIVKKKSDKGRKLKLNF